MNTNFINYDESVSSASVLSLLISSYKLSIISDNDHLPNIELFKNPEGRVSEQTLIDIWSYLESKSKVACYALLLGKHVDPTSKGVLMSLVTQCHTVKDGIDTFIENIDWMGPSESWRSEKNDSFTDLYYTIDYSKGYPVSATIKSMTALVSWAREFSPQKIDIVSACFEFEKPASHNLFPSIFGKNITFSSEFNMIRFKTVEITHPLITYSQYLKELLQTILNNNINNYKYKTNDRLDITRKSINDLIVHLLPKNKANIETVSSYMCISRQTLYRYLQKENTNFKKILFEARKEQAIKLLKIDDISVLSISEQLGYKETSSFYAAFKTWFGITVGEYRKLNINSLK